MTNRFLFSLLILLSFSAQADIFPRSVFDHLDYGLYWAGPDNQFEKAGNNTANGSRFYSRNKPTLIYIHGWQNGSTRRQEREDFYNGRHGRPNIDFARMWRNKGYNVGIMYWNQFADEGEVKDAEAKIWSSSARRGMRWRDSRGNYHNSGLNRNVSEILLASYKTAMAGYQGNDLRIAGHSLGNQLAIKLTHDLKQQASQGLVRSALIPQRISLLDAHYTNGGKDYLNNRWVGEVARDMVRDLKADGTAIDSYRTSSTTSTIFVGDQNKKLHNEVAFAEMATHFFWFWQQGEKHGAAIWLYLWSIDYPTPRTSNSSYAGISASTPNWVIREWMYSDHRVVQTHGRRTKDPRDNRFKTRGRL